jgi:pyruvate,water dikinase
VRNGEVEELLRRWYEVWYPEMERGIEALHGVDTAALTDDALRGHLDAAIALMARGREIHFALARVNPLAMYELVTTAAELLGLAEAEALELVAGLSVKSTEPAHRLGELADLARGRPELRRLLQHPGEATPERLAEADPEFAAAFAAYLDAYGRRALAFDLREPTIAESPELVIGWIRDQLATGHDGGKDGLDLARRREAAERRARERLRDRPQAERRFDRALERTRGAYPAQEDNVFSTSGLPAALGRLALREPGARLAARGVLERGADVFLEIDEATAVTRGPGRQGARQAAKGGAALGRGPTPARPPTARSPPTRRFVGTRSRSATR